MASESHTFVDGPCFCLCPTKSCKQGRRNERGARGPQILADKLTLFQPEGMGQFISTTLLATPDFQTFRRPWLVHLISVRLWNF